MWTHPWHSRYAIHPSTHGNHGSIRSFRWRFEGWKIRLESTWKVRDPFYIAGFNPRGWNKGREGGMEEREGGREDRKRERNGREGGREEWTIERNWKWEGSRRGKVTLCWRLCSSNPNDAHLYIYVHVHQLTTVLEITYTSRTYHLTPFTKKCFEKMERANILRQWTGHR